MSNSLDPDQDQHSVGPDLGPNHLQRLSTDNKSQFSKEELMNMLTFFIPVGLIFKFWEISLSLRGSMIH